MPKGVKNKQAKTRGVKKTLLKQKKKVHAADHDAKLEDDKMDDVRAQLPRETSHELFKRHAAERKQVQQKLADLKRERAKLLKKTNKDRKKAISQEIKNLVKNMKERHVAELKAAGVEKGSNDAELESQDEDDDDM
mmetsp:Transcript_69124/g.123073  ORF Transcript_69124/g.123073 Transcript_69124/m.123073 type:complete len:136 (-) Transcript_69124:68-475(-)